MMNPVTQSFESSSSAPSSPGSLPASGHVHLAEVARTFFRERELPQVFRIICEEACRVLQADSALVCQLASEDEDRREVLHAHQLPAKYIELIEGAHGPSILTREVFQSVQLEVLFHSESETGPLSGNGDQKFEHKTICVIPLLVDDRPFGVLALFHLAQEKYALEERQIAEALGEFASLAIEKNQALNSLQGRIGEQKSLQRALRQITSGHDVHEIVQSVLAESEHVMGTDRCYVMLPDPQTGEPRHFSTRGISSDFVNRLAALPEPFPIGKAYCTDHKNQEPTVVPDATLDPLYGPIQAAEGHKTLAGFPLRVDGGNIGAVFFYWTSFRNMDDHTLSLGQMFADEVAVAIHNARLYRESQTRAKYLEIANEIAKAVGSSLDPEEILKTTVWEIRKNIPCDRCMIGYLEGSRWRMLHGESDIAIEPFLHTIPQNDLHWHRELYEHKKAINIADVRDYEIEFAKSMEKVGVLSLLLVPILQDGRCISHIALNSKEANAFTAEHTEFLTSISSHVGSAIQNARLHKEAQKSSDFFRSVVEDNADAIIITDLDRRILCWNEQAERLYGYSEAEAVGKNVVDLIIPEDQQNHIISDSGVLKESLRKENVVCSDAIRRRKDGSSIQIEVTLSPVKNWAGEVVAICGFSKDLTERLQTEETLRQAKEAAEKANEAKSEFLANISHELRSPLNSVIGFSELLMLKSKDEESLRLLPKIRDAGKYLSRLIDDLRDIERIEAGKLKLEFSEVSLNVMLSQLIDTWKANLPDGFQLENHFDPDYRTLKCDPIRITQVLNNLLDNAVKYSPQGGKIRVRTEARENEAWISVHDEGIGISDQDRKQIFNRFHQVARGRPETAGGLGIGLYLVRELLVMHGGRIWVDGKQGIGSTFTFSLPYETVKESGAASKAGPGKDESIPKNEPWAGSTVLLVDDIEMFHEYINMLMKSASKISSAYNGMEGVMTAKREKPDIILMDLRMPVMNGFEAIEKIKSDPETQDIPILAVTAQVMEEDKARCAQLGVAGFVTKPIEIQNLVEQVEQIVSKKA